jgi:mannitol-1-phosphate/altronate dehydrogenase
MVDPQLLQVALARAITDSMSKEDQHVVLAQAMNAYLFTKTREGYSSKETDPLSQAFQKALDGATWQLVRDFLNEPAQKERMLAAVRVAFEQAMAAPAVTDKLAEKFLTMFSRL